MSTAACLFFFSYLALQVVLPLRRYYFSARDILYSSRAHFSWTMKLKAQKGELFLIIYVKESGKEVGIFRPEDFLLPDQLRYIRGHPADVIHLVKHLARILEEENQGAMNHLGIKAFCLLDINERGAEVMIDENYNLNAASVHAFRNYSWLKKQ
jgi:hypothetical protein